PGRALISGAVSAAKFGVGGVSVVLVRAGRREPPAPGFLVKRSGRRHFREPDLGQKTCGGDGEDRLRLLTIRIQFADPFRHDGAAVRREILQPETRENGSARGRPCCPALRGSLL